MTNSQSYANEVSHLTPMGSPPAAPSRLPVIRSGAGSEIPQAGQRPSGASSPRFSPSGVSSLGEGVHAGSLSAQGSGDTVCTEDPRTASEKAPNKGLSAPGE